LSKKEENSPVYGGASRGGVRNRPVVADRNGVEIKGNRVCTRKT